MLAGPAFADGLPSGGTVAHGKVSIAKPARNRMQIRQGSKSAIVNWNGFSIGRGDRVDIVQPSKRAAILNRVTGDTKSSIRGRLSANGQVYLVNPNGIEITRSGKVRAEGFVASTLDIEDRDFRKGRRVFASGEGAPAAVSNAGAIDARGYAALLGGKVDNAGVIGAELGSIGIGAGRRATLKLSGDFLQVALPPDGDPGAPLIASSGVLRANGGRVEIRAATAREAARQAINLSGVVEARSVGKRGGAIVIAAGAGGEARLSGTLDARADKAAARARGGSVEVTGDAIRLEGARIDASGPAGGGEIHVGGDLRGQGPRPRARRTGIDAASVIAADATARGVGGTIVVWSDDHTRFAGRVSARGGPQGGAGGFAEVSGKRLLSFTGTADLRGAPFGTLLLDPYNITISDDPTARTNLGLDGGWFVSGNGDNSILNATQLEGLLAFNNVNVISSAGAGTQEGDITVEAALEWTSTGVLTLNANAPGATILIDNTITAPQGTLQLASLGDITTTAAAGINVGTLNGTASGDIQIGGRITAQAGSLTAGGDLSTAGPGLDLGDSFDIEATAGDILLAAPLGGADVTITAGGDIDTTAAGAIAAEALTLSAGGDISALGAVEVGLFDLQAGDWAQNADTLPVFAADDFQINGTATFLRVLGDDGGAGGDAFILTDAYGLQGVSGFPGSAFVLDDDIDASGTAGWNQDEGGGFAGFEPIAGLGDGVTVPFTGDFDGAGFTIDGLTIAREFEGPVGLFASLGAGASVVDLSLTGVSILGGDTTGGLAGEIQTLATVTGVSVAGDIGFDGLYAGTSIGGLAGVNAGSILDSSASASISAVGSFLDGDSSLLAGGLIGDNSGIIANSSASGAVVADAEDGGLILVGGLVGSSTGAIEGSSATGAVAGSAGGAGGLWAGGLVGGNNGVVITSFATGDVSGSVAADAESETLVAVGGLVGVNADGGITDAFATGDVAGSATGGGDNASVSAGGLVGGTDGGTVLRAFAGGDVRIAGDDDLVARAGGLVGSNTGGISDAFATGAVTSAGGGDVGGLVGSNGGTIARTYATGLVSDGGDGAGGLVGFNAEGGVDASFWDTQTSGTGFSDGGEGLTTAEFQDTAGFFARADPAGWNFQTTWAPSSAGFYPEIYTINAVVRVDPGDATRRYGLANPPFTVADFIGGPGIFVFGPGGDAPPDFSVTLSTLADQTSGIGAYDIVASGTATSPLGVGYRAVSLDPGTLTVTPAPLTITARNQRKTYGETFVFDGDEFRTSPLFNGDTVDLVTLDSLGAGGGARVAGSPYAITASDAVGTGLGNYDISFASGAFTVDRAPLTITADNQRKTYGETFVFDGDEFRTSPLFNGDTVDLVTLDSLGAGGGARVAGSPYAITASDAVGTGLGNYDISFVAGALTVDRAPLTITARNQRKTYGETFVFDGDEFRTSPLFNGDTVDLVTLDSLGAGGGARVAGSPYAIEASDAVGTGLGNYDISFASGALTVDRAPLTITADNQRKAFGDRLAFRGDEFGVAGLRNEDRVNLATLTSEGAPAGAAVGDYDIAIGAARGVGLDNYDVAYVPGTLEVAPRIVRQGTNIVSLIPEIAFTLVNPPDVIELALAAPSAALGGSGGGSAGDPAGGRPPEALGAAAGAADMLGYLGSASARLEANVAACRQTVTDSQAYLACLGVALDTYAAAIDARILDLPAPLRGVAATIRQASQALRDVRATAARRLAAAGSDAQRAAIEREAVEAARTAVAAAAREVREAITLLRADEPRLASLGAAQGEEVAEALDVVVDGLIRAVGL